MQKTKNTGKEEWMTSIGKKNEDYALLKLTHYGELNLMSCWTNLINGMMKTKSKLKQSQPFFEKWR